MFKSMFAVLAALVACASGFAAEPARSIAFEKLHLCEEFQCEGAYYGDFNKDGRLDVVSGPFWYQGPDFKQKHQIREVNSYDPKGYSDNFLTYTDDFNGDGWTDVFFVPFPGKEGYWYENPAGKDKDWQQHLAHGVVDNESPMMGDIDGDGRLDLVFNSGGQLGYATFDPQHPDQAWQFHAISPKGDYQRFTHGIGFGDINGDGRVDMLEAGGWWEQPAEDNGEGSWKKHPFRFAAAAAQMFAYDVDDDGLLDVITSWHCHNYGLVWYEQLRDDDGQIVWRQHVILDPEPDTNSDAFRVSQLHGIDLVDMDGDGLKDILTGKRFWAHGPAGDAEPNAPAVVVWFQLVRGDDKGVSFRPHVIDDDSGVGTQVAATDLNGDDVPDVIVGNKKGTFVHLSK